MGAARVRRAWAWAGAGERGEGQLLYSLVIPAYNEAARIGQTLESYYAVWDQELEDTRIHYEIIVVANGCSDDTAEPAMRFAEASAILEDLRPSCLPEVSKGAGGIGRIPVRLGSTVRFTNRDGLLGAAAQLPRM